MSNAVEILRSMGERFQTAGNVKHVFGEPITVEGKTVIPVARIGYGFGAGGGRHDLASEAPQPERPVAAGGGGGGGIGMYPAGALEITASGTRFIYFFDVKRAAVMLAAGFVLGLLTRRRRRGR